jgi:hypothetical protein
VIITLDFLLDKCFPPHLRRGGSSNVIRNYLNNPEEIMSVKTLQAIVGAFFIILGLMGILPSVDEKMFSINNHRLYIEVFFGIVELICGVVLIYGLFSYVRRRTLYQASLVILVFWIARFVLSVFIWGFPSFLTLESGLNLLLLVSVELIIASAVLLLRQTYKS